MYVCEMTNLLYFLKNGLITASLHHQGDLPRGSMGGSRGGTGGPDQGVPWADPEGGQGVRTYNCILTSPK